MNTFLAILAATTSLVALGFWAAWITTRIERDVLLAEVAEVNVELDNAEQALEDLHLAHDRAHFTIKRLSDELHAVPNLPDPVAYLRDLVERFKRIGGGLS
ncbi:MAG: hypothetical protein LLG14_20370 [Nocardiaceae bacterium]|nr:hypothetical protein [Nocardiaceae bacterium]